MTQNSSTVLLFYLGFYLGCFYRNLGGQLFYLGGYLRYLYRYLGGVLFYLGCYYTPTILLLHPCLFHVELVGDELLQDSGIGELKLVG